MILVAALLDAIDLSIAYFAKCTSADRFPPERRE
jgi:hypothetical protein